MRRLAIADDWRNDLAEWLYPFVATLGNERGWLDGGHRSAGERKCYLSNLPADTPLKTLAGTIEAR